MVWAVPVYSMVPVPAVNTPVEAVKKDPPTLNKPPPENATLLLVVPVAVMLPLMVAVPPVEIVTWCPVPVDPLVNAMLEAVSAPAPTSNVFDPPPVNLGIVIAPVTAKVNVEFTVSLLSIAEGVVSKESDAHEAFAVTVNVKPPPITTKSPEPGEEPAATPAKPEVDQVDGTFQAADALE